MTAEQELSGYGYYIRPHKAGGLRLYTIGTITGEGGQLQPGQYAEVSMAACSSLEDLVRRAFKERGVDR